MFANSSSSFEAFSKAQCIAVNILSATQKEVSNTFASQVDEANALYNNTNLIVSALIEFDGKIFLNQNADGKLVLPETKVDKDGASRVLKRLIEKAGITAEPGFIYSVYEDVLRDTQHISFLCQADGDAAARGTFTKLSPKVPAQTAEPAVRTMLERFTKEGQLGNFGVYYGNQIKGEVHQLASQGAKK